MTEQQNRAAEYFRREGFLPVDKASYPLFKEYDTDDILFQETTAMVSITYGPAFNAIYKFIHGYLCSVWFYQSGAIYSIVQRPVGTPDTSLQQLVNTLHDLFHESGLPSLPIWAVEESFLNEYRTIEGYKIIAEDSDLWNEYVYRIEDLLELSGGINEEKRRRIKKCSSLIDLLILPVTNENIRTCLKIQEAWCRNQDCPACKSYAGCENEALEIMADLFDERFSSGILAYVNNDPVGYVIGEKINQNLAVLYFAKANISDLNAYLYYRMTKMYFSDVKYLNIGWDMGKTGLRFFKSHLGAYKQWRKYLCTFTSNHRQPASP